LRSDARPDHGSAGDNDSAALFPDLYQPKLYTTGRSSAFFGANAETKPIRDVLDISPVNYHEVFVLGVRRVFQPQFWPPDPFTYDLSEERYNHCSNCSESFKKLGDYS